MRLWRRCAELALCRDQRRNLLQALAGVESVERVSARAGAVLVEPGEAWRFYWLVLEGEMRAERPETDGSRTLVGVAHAGDGFGETPILSGKDQAPFFITATRDSVLMRFTEQEFWKLLACCPEVRKVVLADMAQRLQAYQVEALHREKLVSLGTLAAGLMHELHNPGSAAKRAASQLRENLKRLQELSLRISGEAQDPAATGMHAQTARARGAELPRSGIEHAGTVGCGRGDVGVAAVGRRRKRIHHRAGAGGDRVRPAGA